MADFGLTDEYGLSRNNTLIVLNIPSENKAFVFRIKERVNAKQEKFFYGPLPIAANQTFATYSGGSSTAPAAGVFPALSYTPLSSAMQFPAPTVSGTTLNTYDPSDIWYTPYDYRDTLFEVKQIVTPKFMRIAVSVPTGQNQSLFQKGKVPGGVSLFPASFGFQRGVYSVFQIPYIHYGWLYGNDTNLSTYTSVTFIYGEYKIEIPKNPSLIFDAINNLVPARHTSLPIQVYSSNLTDAFVKTYGIEGFDIFSLDQRAQATAQYASLLQEALV